MMYSSLFIFAFTVVGAIVNAKMAKVATNSQTTSLGPVAGVEKFHQPYWKNGTAAPAACVAVSQACFECLLKCYQHHNQWGFGNNTDCYYGLCNNTGETRFKELCVIENNAKTCSNGLPKAQQTGGPMLENCCKQANGTSLY
ncbi:BQ5605_C030g10824 [Microbotryum silenes-dioicae]|uniref:BQ5605_C030g10824 protein n=1 Tax=Microbotryum silenes-dioicae TaxID=796604 RepID=A0A2X0PIZ5_9BASI|nr:BQ5605_C030g10824 [Microbotryum silenes-dioicae]